MLRLTQLRDFLAVVEAGSLRAAARAVGVSQPAITKSIRRLEAELSVQLLQRNARGAVATAAGKAFLSRARAVQAELRQAEEELDHFRGGRQGSVAFGVAPAATMLIVPDTMTQFRRRYPHAAVRIVEGVTGGLLPRLRDETLDFLIAQSTAEKGDPAIRFRPLFRSILVVAGRVGHPLRGATSLRELQDARWVVFQPAGAGGFLEQAFKTAGAAIPTGVVQCDSYGAALALLAGTDALGLMVPQLLSEAFGHRQLHRIKIRETLPAMQMGLYVRSGTPLTPAALAMTQAVVATARRISRNY